jgi:hypothetical protein
MNAITPARERLVMCLGMLGSAHDGEVLAAAKAAERLRRQSGATWGELLQAPSADGQSEPRGARAGAAGGWREVVRVGLSRAASLSAWERQFLAVLASYQRDPSDKQIGILAGIAAKLGLS